MLVFKKKSIISALITFMTFGTIGYNACTGDTSYKVPQHLAGIC